MISLQLCSLALMNESPQRCIHRLVVVGACYQPGSQTLDLLDLLKQVTIRALRKKLIENYKKERWLRGFQGMDRDFASLVFAGIIG